MTLMFEYFFVFYIATLFGDNRCTSLRFDTGIVYNFQKLVAILSKSFQLGCFLRVRRFSEKYSVGRSSSDLAI